MDITAFLAATWMAIMSIFGFGTEMSDPHVDETENVPNEEESYVTSDSGVQNAANNNSSEIVSESYGKDYLTHNDLLALAGDDYADGEVPLGDGKYNLSGPRKGYVYYCNLPPAGGGAMNEGPWVGENSWNFLEKVKVDGSNVWSKAVFSNVVSGLYRVITGNGLPIGDATGNYPVASNDDAYQYDRNPNSIESQSYSFNFVADPVYNEDPNCINAGQVGIMLNGVPIYDSFDAAYRDAPAHEVQDSCDGHPHKGGVYHYHSLSSCVEDGIDEVIGYANDGFPITGPVVEEGKYLTTDDLDVCHGITSEVTDETGKTYVTYHYVMTYDFPYSISCYRGEPVNTRSGDSSSSQQINNSEASMTSRSEGPPQAAVDACSSLSEGNSCSFTTPNGNVSGTCRNTPENKIACVPAGR